jgi:hypothetical protein
MEPRKEQRMNKSRIALFLSGAVMTASLFATPVGATVTATYGSTTANTPTLLTKGSSGCSSNYCMVGTATFAPSGKVTTNVTVYVDLYRVAKTTYSCTNGSYLCNATQLKESSQTFMVVNGGSTSKQTITLSLTCSSAVSSAQNYFVRVAMTNGSGTVYSESSSLLSAKGC